MPRNGQEPWLLRGRPSPHPRPSCRGDAEQPTDKKGQSERWRGRNGTPPGGEAASRPCPCHGVPAGCLAPRTPPGGRFPEETTGCESDSHRSSEGHRAAVDAAVSPPVTGPAESRWPSRDVMRGSQTLRPLPRPRRPRLTTRKQRTNPRAESSVKHLARSPNPTEVTKIEANLRNCHSQGDPKETRWPNATRGPR